jgi:hypothetical protein
MIASKADALAEIGRLAQLEVERDTLKGALEQIMAGEYSVNDLRPAAIKALAKVDAQTQNNRPISTTSPTGPDAKNGARI